MPLFRAIYQYQLGNKIAGYTFAAMNAGKAVDWSHSMLPKGVKCLIVLPVMKGHKMGTAAEIAAKLKGSLL